MIDCIEFKNWLQNNTSFSSNVISDTCSRIQRANRILPFENEDVYIFKLEHSPEYLGLTISVRSQLKRAVHLYRDFLSSKSC